MYNSHFCHFISFYCIAGLPIQIIEWLNCWVEVNIHIRNCEFSQAIDKLANLRDKSQFGKNEVIDVILGQCGYYNGDLDNALILLKRAHKNNFYILDGLSRASIFETFFDSE